MAKRAKTGGQPRRDLYQEVTDSILAALEQGVVPWRRPWVAMGQPHANLTSKRPYRGVNPFLLELVAMGRGYTTPWWLTFKQANELAFTLWRREARLPDDDESRDAWYAMPACERGGVRKGEKAALVVFWKILRHADKDAPVNPETGKRERTVPVMRHYNVFNVEQVDGIAAAIPPKPKTAALNDHAREVMCEELLVDYLHGGGGGPVVKHGGDRAAYVPALDHVLMPHLGQFNTAEAYYSTLFHELVHSTGHVDRLNRPELVGLKSTFGSDPYAREELVAEMGAAMLSALGGIAPATLEGSAAYIAHWSERFRQDPKLLVSAAGRAQKAIDYIYPEPGDQEQDAEAEEVAAA